MCAIRASNNGRRSFSSPATVIRAVPSFAFV
jgi:hypothetical protein